MDLMLEQLDTTREKVIAPYLFELSLKTVPERGHWRPQPLSWSCPVDSCYTGEKKAGRDKSRVKHGVSVGLRSQSLSSPPPNLTCLPLTPPTVNSHLVPSDPNAPVNCPAVTLSQGHQPAMTLSFSILDLNPAVWHVSSTGSGLCSSYRMTDSRWRGQTVSWQ